MHIIKNIIRNYVGSKSHKSSFWASLHMFIRRTFAREHFSVVHGQRQYAKGGDFALRRNIHRLEKGLIMRPFRSIFALEYIEETVEAFLKLSRDSTNTSHQNFVFFRWATDVLEEYFQVTTSHPTIEKARALFFSQTMSFPKKEEQKVPKVPFVRGADVLPISYENLWQLAKHRRSVRWYQQKPVPRELIDKAVLVAAQSPSACNRQPFEFRIFDEPEYVQKIAAIPIGARGFCHQIPCLVVLVGQLRAFDSESDRHLIYIDSSLAAMAFQFALEVQGLSSCTINWRDVTELEEQLASLIELAPDERPILYMSVGYPDPEGKIPYSEKRPLEEIRSYNKVR